jgi:hypothetical protein
VTARHRRPAGFRRLGASATLVLAVLLTGCGPDVAVPPASRAPGASKASPNLTAVPGGPASAVLGPSIGPPSTTQTAFGTIFDRLPASFPRLPGQEPADTGEGATSGSFAVNLDARAASQAMQTALIAGGWTADVGSPLEDGSVVLEAARSNGCKAEVRFTPRSGTVLMSVLYGSKCPFG